MLNRFNTKQKLTIIIFIPFIGLLFFASSSILSKYNSIKILDEFDTTLKFAKQISKTIYHLQKERGYSTIYITSHGTHSKQQLLKQRYYTDIQINKLHKFVEKKDYLSSHHKNIFDDKILKANRKNIDNFSLNTVDTLFYYTDTITNLIHQMSNLSSFVQDKTIGAKVQALLYMVRYIEFNAIERGVASEIFVSQKLDSDSFLELNSYKYNAKAELNGFNKIASVEMLKYYKKILTTDKTITQYNHLVIFIYNSIYKNEILSSMKDIVGYGGLIHDFKNYLLRGRPKYKDYFFKKYELLKKQIQNYKSYQTTEVEDYYLQLIESTFKEYKNSFKIVDINREKDIKYIDKAVMINDEDALLGFDALHSGLLGVDVDIWFDTTSKRIDKLKEVESYIFNDLSVSIKHIKNKYESQQKYLLFALLFLIVLVITLTIIILNDISSKLLNLQDGIKSFLSYISRDEKEFNYLEVKGNDEFAQMAKNLNQSIMQTNRHIYQEIKKASSTEKQIQENTKMVQMGEMIGNIAHQWRQPLSAIGTSASGMKVENALGLLSKDDIDIYCDNISLKAEYLSKTIDTFRDFIKDKKELKKVNIFENIDEVIKIVSATLDDNYIKLIKYYDDSKPVEAKIVASELSQVIINLINNAKDILVEKQTKEPLIMIDCKVQNDKIIIIVEDNAGGVPQNIIKKIFDPYFTTKHKSQGTGLGLHMSKRIATETLNGDLIVENSDIGAKFSIIFQKNIKDLG